MCALNCTFFKRKKDLITVVFCNMEITAVKLKCCSVGDQRGISLADRITSYNVCYTKLLRWKNKVPGERELYSNIGSAVLGYLVEVTTGTDFNTYCRQNIFTPLEMNNTSYSYNFV